MQLSGELFRQILSQLKGLASDDEQRIGPRVGMHHRVLLTPLGSESGKSRPVVVSVRDMSVDGIGILHHVRLPAKSLFAIRLPVYGTRDITAVYSIKHCDVLEKDLFRIGGVLLKIDDPEGIASMAHHKTAGPKKPTPAAEESEAPAPLPAAAAK